MSSKQQPTYTVVSCHYGDPFWIEHLLTTVEQFSESRVVEAVIVDQSRESADMLAKLPLVREVLTFEANAEQIAIEGHDHPYALDRAVHETTFRTSHIIVMDSDAFPTNSRWLEGIDDIALALTPGSKRNTHPCFMVFPVADRDIVNFSEGFVDRAHRKGAPDTGRRVGAQLHEAGRSVTLLEDTPAFNGYRGSFYRDGTVYHHGHGSFMAGGHDQYKGFVSQASEKLYRKRILQGRFHLTPMDFLGLFVRYAWRRAFNKVRLALMGPSAKPE